MDKAWWKEAVVYQIYPRSFMDSNGDGIGDLNGITSRLEYLQQLGIDVIWLSPVYQSPNDDNGYDISDYQAIMMEFGTMEDFDRLLARSHELGIKIMMDLVVNHTSDEHRWFLESRKSSENPYRDYYIWREGKEGGLPPNNWGSYFSGSAWEKDAATGMYYLHLFSRKQPDLNWDNPKVREEVFSMMRWWCDKGIDGFRMDVISLISKPEGLPDGKAGANGLADSGCANGLADSGCANGPRVHEYLRQMNREVLSEYDLITVGEASGVTIEEAQKYANAQQTELNMVFQFDHVGESAESRARSRFGKWDGAPLSLIELKKILSDWQTGLQGKAWNSLYFSNHDQPRCVSRFGDDRKEYRALSAKMLATCNHFMQGTPYVYQGEELGMTNAYFDKIEDYRDIETLNTYHDLTENHGVSVEEMMGYLKAVSRDNARTPMQWDDSPNAGFTTGTPWIGVCGNYKEINAENQIHDPDSVYSYYKELIRLRHTHEVMVYGSYKLLLPEDENLFVYTRTLAENKLLVICNFTSKQLSFPEEAAQLLPQDASVLISNYKEPDRGRIRPYEAVVYVWEEPDGAI